MTIKIENNTALINDIDSNLENLLTQLLKINLENNNIILDLINYRALQPKDLNIFLSIAKNLRTNKQSFVIVINNFDFNKASDKINIVPTILEAYDIIEMEMIERDLGF